MELATDEVCTVVGKSDVGKSDLDGEGSAEELAEGGNDVDAGEPASGESESGERESGEIAEEPAAEGNGVDAGEPGAGSIGIGDGNTRGGGMGEAGLIGRDC